MPRSPRSLKAAAVVAQLIAVASVGLLQASAARMSRDSHQVIGLCNSRPPEGLSSPTVAFVLEEHSSRVHGNPGPMTLYATTLDGSKVWRLERRAVAPTASPDGLRIAFSSYSRGIGGRLRVMDLHGRCRRSLGSTYAGQPAWSPNGRQLAFSDGPMFVADDAGHVRRLTKSGTGRPNWSPTGRELAFSRGNSLWVVHADGTAERRIAPGTMYCQATPQWLRDNKSIAFCGRDHPGCIDETLRIFSIRTGRVRTVWRECFSTLLRSPTDDTLAVLDYTDSELVLLDPHSRRITRIIRRSSSHRLDFGRLAWSANGRFLFFSRRGQIWIVRRDGTGLRQVTRCVWPDGACIEPQWLAREPDGARRIPWSAVN